MIGWTRCQICKNRQIHKNDLQRPQFSQRIQCKFGYNGEQMKQCQQVKLPDWVVEVETMEQVIIPALFET